MSQATSSPQSVTEKVDSPNVPEQNTGRPAPKLTDQTNLLPTRQVIPIVFGLSLVALVTTLDQVVISASLTTVSAAFNAGSISAWIPAAYLMTSTAFQPLYGRLSDIFGRKSAIAMAMGFYIVGNLIAGFAKSVPQLIVFRAIAGVGDGGATTMIQVVVSDILSLRDRGKFIGYAAGVTTTGYTIGPIIGGALSQHVSWRWAFWITLPVAFFATVAVVFLLPLKPVQGDMRSKLLLIDYVGILLTLGASTMLILPLIWGGVTFPWSSAIVLGPLCAVIVVVGIFCVWEVKGAKLPLIPMYIFRHMTVVGVYICMFINGFVYFSMLFYLPQFFQVILGYSPTHSGILIISFVLPGMVTGVGAGIWVSRTGTYRFIVYSGYALFAIACGCITIFNAHTSRVVMVVLMILAGAGIGGTQQTTTVAAQASVERKDMAVVSAVRNFLRMLGGALALPSSAALLNNAMHASLNSFLLSSSMATSIINNPSVLRDPSNIAQFGLSESQAEYILSAGYNKGFKDIFILNASLASLALVVSVVMIKHKELLRGDEEKLRAEAKAALRTRATGSTPSGDQASPEENIEMGKVHSE